MLVKDDWEKRRIRMKSATKKVVKKKVVAKGTPGGKAKKVVAKGTMPAKKAAVKKSVPVTKKVAAKGTMPAKKVVKKVAVKKKK